MPIKTTIGCAALAIAACFGISAASASPLVANKGVSAAASQVHNVDYHCYRHNGRRYCRDTYEDYDDYGHWPGVAIGVGRRHHHHPDHGGVHYYRGSPGGGPSGHVVHGPSGGGMRVGGGGPAGAAGHAFGGAIGGLGGGGVGGHR
jgi:hypothetical protein